MWTKIDTLGKQREDDLEYMNALKQKVKDLQITSRPSILELRNVPAKDGDCKRFHLNGALCRQYHRCRNFTFIPYILYITIIIYILNTLHKTYLQIILFDFIWLDTYHIKATITIIKMTALLYTQNQAIKTTTWFCYYVSKLFWSCLLLKHDNLTIVAIYRSPSFRCLAGFFNDLNYSLSILKLLQNILLIGDLNIDISAANTDIHKDNSLNLTSSYDLLSIYNTLTRISTC